MASNTIEENKKVIDVSFISTFDGEPIINDEEKEINVIENDDFSKFNMFCYIVPGLMPKMMISAIEIYFTKYLFL